MKTYIKHLIECKCVLSQFKNLEPTRWHSFVVFSVIKEDGSIIPSFAQCNHCAIVHKITEVGVSSVTTKENIPGLETIESVSSRLPKSLTTLLEKYNPNLPLLQEIEFIISNGLWGKTVILNKEKVEGFLVGTQMMIIGETLWKLIPFQEEIDE